MKYRILYEQGCKILEEAGIEEAKLDAGILLETVCGTNRNDLFAHGDKEVTEGQEEQYRAWIEKRRLRTPLQYITGVQAFMGLEFSVNEHVLIPRQDTEILVEEALRFLHDGMEILDMCTGSGCILLSLLHYSNHCKGTGADVSRQALETAADNARTLGLRPAWVQGDLFENVQGRFDLILSNPPYIATQAIPQLMPEVREHEPLKALDGREDGLYFYDRIIKESRQFLYRGGMLFFEIGFDQADAVKQRMEQAGFREIAVVKDYAGLDRVVYGTYIESY